MSRSVFAALLALLSIGAANAQIYVANNNGTSNGSIGEYTTSGATKNAALISGLEGPDAIAVAPVPLPGSIWLMLSGIAGIGAAAVKRRAG